MKSEDVVQQEIMMTAPAHNCVLMRNNSGAMQDATGRLVRYGLGNESKTVNEMIKSSDLIGITTITITSEMVGQQVGIFTAVEVKKENWKFSLKNKRERAQQAFINWVISKGGLAGFAKSLDDLELVLRK